MTTRQMSNCREEISSIHLELLGAAFAFLVWYAYAEFILILIAIEENTRTV